MPVIWRQFQHPANQLEKSSVCAVTWYQLQLFLQYRLQPSEPEMVCDLTESNRSSEKYFIQLWSTEIKICAFCGKSLKNSPEYGKGICLSQIWPVHMEDLSLVHMEDFILLFHSFLTALFLYLQEPQLKGSTLILRIISLHSAGQPL